MTLSRASFRITAGLYLCGALSIAIGAPIARTGDADAFLNAASGPIETNAPSEANKASVLRARSRLPMHFESNTGQFHGSIKFGTRGSGYQLYLTGKETVVSLQKSSAVPADPKARREWLRKSKDERLRERARAPRQVSTVVRKSFLGANPDPEVVGDGMLPGKSHYLIGNDPARWRKDVPHYAKVRYRGVYPGIDLVYYGSEGRLEYDWIVAPGADPHRIVEAFRGARSVRIAGNGDLVVDTRGGSIWQRKPILYQEIDGSRVSVDGGYVTLGEHSVGFRVGRYDRSLPLIIDPVLEYSTYLGGSLGDSATAVAVSASGEAYVTGTTESPDFPHGATDFQIALDEFGRPTAVVPFVTKFNAAGDGIVYSTYFGGTGFNGGTGIALGADGSAYVTGITQAADFPATAVIGNGAQDPFPATFVVKLAPSGSAMSYSTLIGGDGGTTSASIAVDASGSAFVAGTTSGAIFPTTAGAFLTQKPTVGSDGFVVKLRPDGSGPVYSTLFGGPGPSGVFDDFSAFTLIQGIAIDSAGNAYIAGRTASPLLPLANAYQGVKGNNQDGFFAKIDPSGSSLVYSSYLGGDGSEQFFGIAVDGQGNAYMTGLTAGCCFPVVNPLPDQVPVVDGGTSAVVAKVNPSGGVAFATLLGADSAGNAVAVDKVGSVYVTGSMNNQSDFPLVGDLGLGSDPALRSDMDAFVSKISTDGSSFGFSIVIGGNGLRPGDPRFGGNDFRQDGPDIGNGIAVDPLGGVYVVGQTFAADFPTLDAVQSSLTPSVNITPDAFVLKLFEPSADVGLFSTGNPSVVGQSVTFTAIVPDAGATGTVTFFDGTIALGTVPLASGVAKFSTSTLSVGTHSITATYSGDASHPAATSSVLVQEVLDPNAQRQATSTTLSATGNPDRSVTLTAVVTGANPTGLVTFLDNHVNNHVGILSSGTATVTIRNPAAGPHTITATYAGDVRNSPSTSAPLSLLIGPPAVSFSAPVNDTALSIPATIQITVAATAQIGASITAVNLFLNGAPLASLTTPPYTFALANAPPGLHTLGVQATDSFGQTSALSTVRVRVFDPGVTFFLHDLQGNVIAATDGVGAVVYTENYLPFGGRRVANPAGQVAQQSGNRLWFHGKAQDEATGLQYFGARYYDPAIGRFMGVDKVGFDENNLHSFNRYGYGNNNPYRYTDPDGKSPTLVIQIPFQAAFIIASRLGAMALGGWIGRELWGILHNEAENPNETPGTGGQAKPGDGSESKNKPTESGDGSGNKYPDRPLPRDKRTGDPVPDPEAEGPYSQLGQQQGRKGKYDQAREFDADGKHVRDVDFTDHGRGHPNPHQHRYKPNPTGGTPERGGPEPLN